MATIWDKASFHWKAKESNPIDKKKYLPLRHIFQILYSCNKIVCTYVSVCVQPERNIQLKIVAVKEQKICAVHEFHTYRNLAI